MGAKSDTSQSKKCVAPVRESATEYAFLCFDGFKILPKCGGKICPSSKGDEIHHEKDDCMGFSMRNAYDNHDGFCGECGSARKTERKRRTARDAERRTTA